MYIFRWEFRLAENGRLPAAEIAERVGNVTERTIRNRINSLVERRLLFFGAIADPQVSDSIYIDLMVDTEPGRMAEVACILVEFTFVEWVAYGCGDHDVYASIRATGKRSALDIIERVNRIPGVRKARTVAHLAVLKTHGFKLRAADELRERLAAGELDPAG